MRALILAATMLAAACAPGPSSAPSVAVPYQLPSPTVVMEADPPPPFTYWAPEAATIRNHPHVPGIWQAFVQGKSAGYYFGDACRASDYQNLIGQPLSAVPALPAGVERRDFCRTCAHHQDLRPNRLNVVFDEQTQKIVEIACH